MAMLLFLRLSQSIFSLIFMDPQVVDSVAIGLSSFKKKYLFGTGNLEKLRGIVLGNERITAVRIGSG